MASTLPEAQGRTTRGKRLLTPAELLPKQRRKHAQPRPATAGPTSAPPKGVALASASNAIAEPVSAEHALPSQVDADLGGGAATTGDTALSSPSAAGLPADIQIDPALTNVQREETGLDTAGDYGGASSEGTLDFLRRISVSPLVSEHLSTLREDSAGPPDQDEDSDAASATGNIGEADARQSDASEDSEGTSSNRARGKQRQANKTADRYRAAQERFDRSQVLPADPAAGAPVYRRSLLSLRTTFNERAIRDGGLGALFIAHPHVHGPPNGRAQLPYLTHQRSPRLATPSTSASIPSAQLDQVSRQLEALADRDGPVLYSELYDIMLSLFTLVVRQEQETVVATNAERNKKKVKDLADAQRAAEQRAAQAEEARYQAERQAKESQEREKLLEMAAKEAKKQRDRMLETLVGIFMSQGKSESDARAAALEAHSLACRNQSI